MIVETYECEETKEEATEESEAAIALIEELDLEGQRTLLKKGGGPQRCPYRQMTADEDFIFRVLCPDSTAITSYREGPIPLRVLQVAAHAKQLGVFKEIRVWHQKGAVQKDPLLVGTMTNAESSWRNDHFILARWGEELEEWPAMVKQGLAKWRELMRDHLNGMRAEAEMKLASLDKAGLSEAIKQGIPSA